MELIEHLDNIKNPFRNAVITIGNFDGVHIGHQALFREVVQQAEMINGTSVGMTFEPHPISVLSAERRPPLITLYEQKVELIEKTGIQVLICVPFTLEFARISAETFVEDILVRRIGAKIIVVGPDYTFGADRTGDVEFLKEYSKRFDYDVIVPDWIQASFTRSGRISSTRIRECVMDGRVAEARHLLGRFYQIRGTVVSGRNRGGKLLGFPTANICLHDELCPRNGVYAVTAEYNGKTYQAVANIGYSPTFDDRIYTVEVHLLDFNQDLYNQKIRVNFIERIRDEIKFSSIDALKQQIQADIVETRKILANHK